MSGMMIKEKSQEEVEKAVAIQKEYYSQGKTKSLETRKNSLKKLAQLLRENESKILMALHKDLNKSEREAYTTEIGILLEEINFTLKNIDTWAKPQKVKTALTHFGSKGYRIPEPYGVSDHCTLELSDTISDISFDRSPGCREYRNCKTFGIDSPYVQSSF